MYIIIIIMTRVNEFPDEDPATASGSTETIPDRATSFMEIQFSGWMVSLLEESLSRRAVYRRGGDICA